MKVVVPPTSAFATWDLSSTLEAQFPIRGLVDGRTIRLAGVLTFSRDAVDGSTAIRPNQTSAYGVFLSPMTGVHSLISSATVERGGSIREYCRAYGRQAAATVTTETTDIVCTSAIGDLELRAGTSYDIASKFPVNQQLTDGTAISTICSFSMRPMLGACYQRFFNADDSDTRISFLFANTANFLINRSPVAAAISTGVRVVLRDLYLSYSTYDATPEKPIKMMEAPTIMTVQTLTASISSALETISLNVAMAGAVRAFAITFIENTNLSVAAYDKSSCIQPPGLSRVRFLLNGQSLRTMFPYNVVANSEDPLYLIQQASKALAMFPGAYGGVAGQAVSTERDFGLRQFVLGQVFEPAVVFTGAATLGVEIASGINTAHTAFVHFLIEQKN